MRTLRIALLLASIAVGALIAATPPAMGEVECAGAQNCVTQAGPWVNVPSQTQPDQFGAMWGANCTNGEAVGSDWNPDPDHNPFDLDVFVEQGSGILIYGQGIGEEFLSVNRTRKAETFQPLIGCQTFSAAAAATQARALASGQAPPVKRRISTHRIKPRRVRTFTRHCRAGEHLVDSGAGVGFFTARPPSDRELRDLHIRRKEHGNEVRVTVRTGRRVGDNERVQLQLHALCQ